MKGSILLIILVFSNVHLLYPQAFNRLEILPVENQVVFELLDNYLNEVTYLKERFKNFDINHVEFLNLGRLSLTNDNGYKIYIAFFVKDNWKHLLIFNDTLNSGRNYGYRSWNYLYFDTIKFDFFCLNDIPYAIFNTNSRTGSSLEIDEIRNSSFFRIFDSSLTERDTLYENYSYEFIDNKIIIIIIVINII